MIFSGSLSGSDDFVLSDSWKETHMFTRYSSFLHKFNSNLWMETATVDMYDADSVLLSDYKVILSGLNTLMLFAFTCLRK